MIELKHDQLRFSFPDVHPEAKLSIDFERTLRIPDDDRDYPLPPGLARFPLCHVDDFAEHVPPAWIEHGGVMLPMYQSEALWLNFTTAYLPEKRTAYPFAIKVATGKINAVTGSSWCNGLHEQPQDYLVAPEQPWLDGYCVEKGIIRQFVAMPLGDGYTAEEQLTGKAEVGGLQVMAFPMKREIFDRRFPEREVQAEYRDVKNFCLMDSALPCAAPDMGLAPGGRMRQEIYDDPYSVADWDLESGSRCFVHIANSLVWRQITGNDPPTTPPTAKEYEAAGLPWFEYYDDSAKALHGSNVLGGLKSVATAGHESGKNPLLENDPVEPKHVVDLSSQRKGCVVREGGF